MLIGCPGRPCDEKLREPRLDGARILSRSATAQVAPFLQSYDASRKRSRRRPGTKGVAVTLSDGSLSSLRSANGSVANEPGGRCGAGFSVRNMWKRFAARCAAWWLDAGLTRGT